MWNLPKFVQDSLPTPWSKAVATTSWLIALLLLFLPEFLPKVGLPPISQETLWPRLFAVSTILFLGSSICLALVVRHYRIPTPQKQTQTQTPPENARLEDIREKFLQLLISHPRVTSQEISSALGKSSELVTFHFTEMEKSKLVHGSYAVDGETEWSIAQGGRAYLALHGLLA